MGAQTSISAQRLYFRDQYPDFDRFLPVAHRGLCSPASASDVAGRFTGGLGGFVVFTAAPGLGLPPELPGMPAAELARTFPARRAAPAEDPLVWRQPLGPPRPPQQQIKWKASISPLVRRWWRTCWHSELKTGDLVVRTAAGCSPGSLRNVRNFATRVNSPLNPTCRDHAGPKCRQSFRLNQVRLDYVRDTRPRRQSTASARALCLLSSIRVAGTQPPVARAAGFYPRTISI